MKAFRISWTVVIAALALLAPSTCGAWGSARAWDLARKFPNFKKQKSQLDTIALVVDVAEFEVERGEATWVFVDDSRDLAQRLEDGFETALPSKGYAVKALPILSVGHGADTTRTCRVFTRWAARDTRPQSAPKVRPPFFVDSTLNATREIESAWRTLVQGTLRIKKGRGKEPPHVTAPSSLREVVGANYALIAIGLGTKNVDAPRGTMVGVPGSRGALALGFPRDPPSPYPGSAVQVALIDLRNGDVLWADSAFDIRPFKDSRMDDIAEDIVAQMP
jgi:hypothetical protein